jgi:hypothetical protein
MTTRLPVEKALEKLRRKDETPASKGARREEKLSELDEEIMRIRAQRLRLAKDQGRRGNDS